MSRSQIEEIKDRLDIVELARSYFSDLKKRGANYFTKCPFHQEKTASFSINPDMGIFKCFGCGEAGDVITLIQKMEGLEFPKALELAAEKAGIKLERRYSKEDEKIYKQKQKILKANSLVCDYYKYILEKHEKGKEGRVYAEKRKITKGLIRKFKLGFAPSSYTNLTRFLSSKGYSIPEQIDWGLAVSRNRKVYDKFRNRLIFPLINHRDEIIGFSGRTLSDSPRVPKYLHSPQTPVFDKGKFLFGLEQAKSEIRKKNFVVFSEGQLDVISSHKTKVKNIVASLGTSLSSDQLKLAKRYTDTVYFSYDNDEAGEKALLRSSSIAYQEGFNVKAINIPQGKDADELINKSRKTWEEAVQKGEIVIDHMIRRLYKRLDLTKVDQKENFAKILLPLVADLPRKIEQAHYLHRIALYLNVNEEILTEEVRRQEKDVKRSGKIDTGKIKKSMKSPASIRENYLMGLILQNPKYIQECLGIVRIKHFSNLTSKKVFKELKKYYNLKKRFSVRNFRQNLEDHEASYVETALLSDLKTDFEIREDFLQELESVVKYLNKNYLKNKIKKIKALIEQAEIAGEDETVDELTEQLKKVADEMRNND